MKHFQLPTKKTILYIIFLTGLIIRFTMISLDPFLHEWDERFHALVAKNMMDSPFLPMLRVDPVGGYLAEAWCCNHIWIHKQPLFLWQMAISLKVFGLHPWAIRLPSAILGSISILLSYDVTKMWTQDKLAGVLAALITCFSYYQLELISGRLSLEHNDLVFYFYVTASIWAFLKYSYNNHVKWAIWVGVFVGCSILVKWLTGLLIFGGWGLYILLDKRRLFNRKYYSHIILSIVTSVGIFLPWQIYTAKLFPVEFSVTHKSNTTHITETIGAHSGDIWFHLVSIREMIGDHLIPFLVVGLLSLLFTKRLIRKLTIPFLSMIIVIVLFFTLVKTKMPAFTYPVNALLISLVAYGLSMTIRTIDKIQVSKSVKKASYFIAVVFLLLLSLRPFDIYNYRSSNNTLRNAKVINTKYYRQMHNDIEEGTVILNSKKFESIEILFFQNYKTHNWFPNKHELDSLTNEGYKFAAFTNNSYYNLPDHIKNDKRIQQIPFELK